MAEPEPSRTMKYSFQVAYDGVPDDHTMDVELLAPAMLALGELVKEANASINGSRSRVNLRVRSDFEHKCFNINFELFQSIYDQLAGLFQSDSVKTAEDVLAALGLLGVTPVGVVQYLKWRRGRRIANVTKLESSDKRGMVSVEVGDGSSIEKIEVHNHVYMLGENPKALNAVAGMIRPLEEGPYQSVEFRRDDAKLVQVNKSDADDIEKTCVLATSETPLENDPQEVTAVLQVYGPVFDENAENWRFLYGDQSIYADITDTTIAKDAISRGGSLVGDTYRVRMRITQTYTPAKRIRNHYKILRVMEFRPAPKEINLFSGPSGEK